MAQKFTTLLLLLTMVCGAPALVMAQEHAAPAAHTAAAGDVNALHDGAPFKTPDVHADASHGHGHDAAHHAPTAPELPTLIHILNHWQDSEGHSIGETSFGKFLKTFEKQIYMLLVVTVMSLLFLGVLRMTALRPGRLQSALEMLVEGLTNFFTGIVGKEHRKHVPFLCSLFLFIWVNNLTALVPTLAPATSKFQTTVALAIMVFFYFIFYGIKDGGLGHFLWHMAGSPRDAVGWAISPAMFVLEIVGNLAKPLSLSLRLFGNIMGEDILLGVFLMLGLMMAGMMTPEPIIGVPLHIPFLFLVLLGSTIQALVFSLLSAIYIAMLLPHHEHEHDHVEGDDKHPLLPGAEENNENSGHVDASLTPFVG